MNRWLTVPFLPTTAAEEELPAPDPDGDFPAKTTTLKCRRLASVDTARATDLGTSGNEKIATEATTATPVAAAVSNCC